MQDDIRAQIKRIKIFTKRLMSESLSGDYLSAFKGAGMEFHQIREYQIGDDVRAIDWNNTVKANKVMVKQFIEERDRTIILMIDVSSSGEYASKLELKRELIAKIASSLAFISSENNDKVGALFFSDKVEKWIAPNRGPSHVNKILENILSLDSYKSGTNIAESLKFLINLKKNGSVVFMLSDFIDDEESYSNLLKVVACKHDFVGMRITDACEREMPDVGLLEISDPENGEHLIIDTKGLDKFLNEKFNKLPAMFIKYKIDFLDLKTDQPFVVDLVKFFRKRIRRSI